MMVSATNAAAASTWPTYPAADAIAQKQAKLEGMQKDTEDKLKIGQDALDELKDVYRKADADKPASELPRGM